MNPEFPAVDLAAWRARVERELKGKDFERSLLLANEDGFVLQPVHDAGNSAPGATSEPGAFPWVRGAAARPGRLLVQEYGDADPETTRRLIERDLAGGVDGLRLRLDRRVRQGLDPAAEKGRSADGVLVFELGGLGELLRPALERDESGRPRARLLAFQAGAEALPVAALVLALRRLEGLEPEELPCHFALDPFAALARDGRLPRPIERHLAEGLELAGALAGDDRAIEIDGTIWQDCGADCPFELGLMAAALAAWAAAARAAGADLAALARRIVLRTAMERDVFVGIAKLRALRQLWALVLAHHGVTEVAPRVWATSSRRSLSQLDPWVNILRTTTQGFAAACGGADIVTVLPFDLRADTWMVSAEEFDGLVPGPNDAQECFRDGATALGRRVARNEMLVLDEEAGLFRVQDPAGGSHYVETLTDRLVAEAFEHLQGITTSGGLAAVLVKGELGEALMTRLGARRDDAMRRRLALTGTNEFPQRETPLAEDWRRRDLRDLKVVRERLRQHRKSRGRLAPIATDEGLVAGLAGAAEQGAMTFELTEALGGRGQGPGIEPPVAMRDSKDFESLRETLHVIEDRRGVQRVFLANLGPLAEHLPRATFARNVLAIPGFEIVDGAGSEVGDAEAAATAILAELAALPAPPAAVCLCGSDERYGEQAEVVARALRATLPAESRILLAGKPDEALAAAGIADFIHLGCDVWTPLNDLLAPMFGEIVDEWVDDEEGEE